MTGKAYLLSATLFWVRFITFHYSLFILHSSLFNSEALQVSTYVATEIFVGKLYLLSLGKRLLQSLGLVLAVG